MSRLVRALTKRPDAGYPAEDSTLYDVTRPIERIEVWTGLRWRTSGRQRQTLSIPGALFCTVFDDALKRAGAPIKAKRLGKNVYCNLSRSRSGNPGLAVGIESAFSLDDGSVA